MASYQRDLFGGETEWVVPDRPDPALAKRLERRDRNREFHEANQGNLSRAGAVRKTANEDTSSRIHADTREFGLDRAQHFTTNEFTPFSHAAWRRFGRYEEVPTDTLYTAQAGVDRRRVAELVEDPSKGVNPRLPDEKPYVLRGRAKVPGLHGPVVRNNTDVLVNGNHRVSSEISKGAMFVPALVVRNSPENREGARELEHQRGMLDQTAEGARMLREGSLSGVAAERTREFVESQRAAYRNVGR